MKLSAFGLKEFDFMRQNRDIMSNEDFGKYFGNSMGEISTLFAEMDCKIDWNMAADEYELQRCLNRFEMAHHWGYKELNDCLDFHERLCES